MIETLGFSPLHPQPEQTEHTLTCIEPNRLKRAKNRVFVAVGHLSLLGSDVIDRIEWYEKFPTQKFGPYEVDHRQEPDITAVQAVSQKQAEHVAQP